MCYEFDATEMREFYFDRFYRNQDAAHGIGHIDEVYESALWIVREKSFAVSPKLLAMCVFIHDGFQTIDRKNHHLLAADYAMESSDRFFKSISDVGRRFIAEAVSQHRSSLDIIPSNIYSRILRTADRGKPDLTKQIRRSTAFTKHHGPELILTDVLSNVVQHMKEKYGRNGRAYSDPDCLDLYGDTLTSFWDEIDDLTIEKAKTMLE